MTPKAVLERRGLGYAHVEANRDMARGLLNGAAAKAHDAEWSLESAAFYVNRRGAGHDESWALAQIDRAFKQLKTAREMRLNAKTYARLAVTGEWRTSAGVRYYADKSPEMCELCGHIHGSRRCESVIASDFVCGCAGA